MVARERKKSRVIIQHPTGAPAGGKSRARGWWAPIPQIGETVAKGKEMKGAVVSATPQTKPPWELDGPRSRRWKRAFEKGPVEVRFSITTAQYVPARGGIHQWLIPGGKRKTAGRGWAHRGQAAVKENAGACAAAGTAALKGRMGSALFGNWVKRALGAGTKRETSAPTSSPADGVEMGAGLKR